LIEFTAWDTRRPLNMGILLGGVVAGSRRWIRSGYLQGRLGGL
jgi:hypothetical protein